MSAPADREQTARGRVAAREQIARFLRITVEHAYSSVTLRWACAHLSVTRRGSEPKTLRVAVREVLDAHPQARTKLCAVLPVSPELPVSRLVYERIMETDERVFPVVAHDDLLGVVSLNDVRDVPRQRWERTTVQDIMTRAERLWVLRPEDDLRFAIAECERRGVQHVPIVENGRVLGIVKQPELALWVELGEGLNVRRRTSHPVGRLVTVPVWLTVVLLLLVIGSALLGYLASLLVVP